MDVFNEELEEKGICKTDFDKFYNYIIENYKELCEKENQLPPEDIVPEQQYNKILNYLEDKGVFEDNSVNMEKLHLFEFHIEFIRYLAGETNGNVSDILDEYALVDSPDDILDKDAFDPDAILDQDVFVDPLTDEEIETQIEGLGGPLSCDPGYKLLEKLKEEGYFDCEYNIKKEKPYKQRE